MPSGLEAQLRRRLGPPVRRWRKRLDNPEVRQARFLVERLRTAPPDVLHLGASESQYVGPNDADQRTLPVMVADALAPDLSFFSINNPGYHPRLFSAYLAIVTTYPVRPVVVVGLTVRFGFSPWAVHPEYGYARSLKALQRIDPHASPRRFRAPVRLTRESDFVAHDAMEYPTVSGTRLIGDFRRTLKDTSAAGPQGDDRARQLFAFHQGGVMRDAYLQEVTALGAQLQKMELPVVIYQLPIPIGRGTELLGDAFTQRALDNLRQLDSAFVAGYGPNDILQTGSLLADDEFINPNDAIEHANERGRLHLTAVITQAVAAHRAS